MYRFIIATLGLAAAIVGLGITAAFAGDGPLTPELQKVRAEVAHFHSFKQAGRAGYVLEEGEPCVSAPPGTMGIHVINKALMANPAVHPLQPEILLYVPKANGQLKFVGVEYFRRAADQTPPIDASDKPSLFGVDFDGPMPEHAPGMGWHYDLHVWVAERNPSGVFAPFNPAISC
jgi:hypothetical protein